jgi:hypothetical protein
MGMLKSFFSKAMLWVNENLVSYVQLIKNFIKGKGFTALLALGLGSAFLLFGFPFIGGVGFGIFFAKNTEIIKDLLIDNELI